MRLCYVTLAAVILAAGGCAKSPEFGEVSGTITRGGKPLPGVEVRFDPETGGTDSAEGRPSVGVTDEQGKYTLIRILGNTRRAVLVF